MASREARKIVTMRTSITTIRPGEEGFTLIELLLVVALITILAEYHVVLLVHNEFKITDLT